MGISFSGLATGLDTKTMIEQLVSIDSRPKLKLEWNVQLQNSRKTAWNELSTKLRALETAASALTRFEAWDKDQLPASTGTGPWTATSSDPARLSAQVTGAATAGVYAIEVQQLARGEVSRSTGALAGGVVSAPETITITQGGSSWDVELSAGDQLSDIAQKINDTAGIGVYASVDGGELRITSNATGAASAFSVSGTGDTVSQLGFVEAQVAQDAKFLVNNQMHSSATNAQITGAINGVTLNLTGITSTSLSLSQGDGSAAKTWEDTIIDKVKTFISSYNAVLDQVHQKTVTEKKVTSPANKSAGLSLNEYLQGPMSGNTAMSSVATQLRMTVGDVVDGLDAGSNMLAAIGIKSTFTVGTGGAQGKLELDEAALRQALSDDPANVQSLISNVGAGDGVTADDGVMRRVSEMVSQMRSSVGAVGTATKAVDSQVESIQRSIDRAQRSIDARRAQYEKMFARLETAMSQMQQQSSWLAGQINSLPKF